MQKVREYPQRVIQHGQLLSVGFLRESISWPTSSHGFKGEATLTQPDRPLDSQRTTERPGGVIGFGTVVIREDSSEPAIAKESAAQFPHLVRRFHPTRSLGI